jgi:hypothetical protein
LFEYAEENRVRQCRGHDSNRKSLEILVNINISSSSLRGLMFIPCIIRHVRNDQYISVHIFGHFQYFHTWIGTHFVTPERLLASQEEELFAIKLALPLHYNEWTDEWKGGWETDVISLRRPLLLVRNICFCNV